jgi:hypothetical protein
MGRQRRLAYSWQTMQRDDTFGRLGSEQALDLRQYCNTSHQWRNIGWNGQSGINDRRSRRLGGSHERFHKPEFLGLHVKESTELDSIQLTGKNAALLPAVVNIGASSANQISQALL